MNDKFFKTKILRNFQNKFLNVLQLRLWRHLRRKRKIQIFGLIFLIINLGIFEIFTLFALQEFLAFLTNPTQIEKYQITNIIVKIFDIDNSNDLLVTIRIHQNNFSELSFLLHYY